MKRIGSVHWMLIAGLVGVAIIVVMLLMGGNSATKNGAKFMAALSTGDINGLVQTSYIPDKTPEEMKTEWEATLKRTKYVMFRYTFTGEDNVSEDQATIRMNIMKPSTGYDEVFALPMRKIDGEWKVEVRGLSRQFYPFLPR